MKTAAVRASGSASRAAHGESSLATITATGVEFIDDNGGGPGVRLRKGNRKKD
jgi:hypothetical protein